MDDMALLREYAARNSEAAFETLVSRRVNFVYSAALRQVRNADLAEEVTQAVFIILAQKAGRISDKTILTGWLFKTTRFAALAQIRAAARRRRYEQEAQMQSELQPSAPDLFWEQMSPLLDEALATLGETDRQAVLLRFFENKSLAEVGSHFGTGEDTARKRVSRALEKLHRYFSKRGVSSTTAIIAGAMSTNSVQAAPAVLTKAVTAMAVAKGAAASASTLTLVKGALNIMAWTKAQTAIVAGVIVLLAAWTVATSSKLLHTGDDAIAFEAEGTITYATAPDSRGSYSDTKHFTIMRQGDLWKIRTITEKQERTGPGGPVGDSIDLYYEMGFDGVNIYTLEQQDQQKVLPRFSAETLRSGRYSLALGRVEKADSPPCMDIYKLYPVWLAYCSAPYFKNLKGDQAVSPLFADRDFLTETITRMQLPAKWNMNGKSFLKDVSWFSDGKLEAHWPDGKITIEKYPAPYDTAFIQARFENTSWTNFGGSVFPSSFKLVVYHPDYKSTNVAKFQVSYTITGALGQIRGKNKFSPLPELTTRTLITDWRIKRRGQINSYVSTNRWDFSDAIHQPKLQFH